MTSVDALNIARDAIIVALKLGAPAMLLALAVGLVISFIQALAGKADLADVVTAVSNAELTLQTVVAVRDRVVAAYLDILKMPI